MSSFLYRLGRSCAAHPWRVIGAWILLVATVGARSPSSFGAPLRDDWDVPGARPSTASTCCASTGSAAMPAPGSWSTTAPATRCPPTELAELTAAAAGPRARGRGQSGPAQRGP